MQNYQTNNFILIISLLLISLVACRPKPDRLTKYAFVTRDSIQPPVVVKAGEPAIILLSHCPPPQVIDLKTRPAPVKIEADFYVTMQNYNTDQGLALSSILCGFKDKAGNLWFGTSGNGVSKYDGKSFTNFYSLHGLIHNLINCISEDSKGNIWFGTYGGVSRYNGKSFENFTTAEGLPNNNINCIVEDDKGNIWIATSGGLSRYTNGNGVLGSELFINYSAEHGLAGNDIGKILQDRNGNLWIADGIGISKYDPVAESNGKKAFVNYSKTTGLEDKKIYSITEDKEGLLWFGTNKGVVRYDPAKEGTGKPAYVIFTTVDGLINNKIICGLEDREGNIWFGTKEGVSEFRKTDSSFVNYTTEQGLANNEIASITEDNTGNLWFGTIGGGLSRYDGKSIIELTSKQGLPVNTVFAIAEDKDSNLWMGGSEGGIAKYVFNRHETTGESFLYFSKVQGLTDHQVMTMIFDHAGNLWFGSDNGLSKYDGKSIVTYKPEQGLINNRVVSLEEDSKGNIWVGTYETGISKFDGKSFENYTTETGLVHNTVWDIHEDKSGDIWFATRGGLSRFDGINFLNLTRDQGLPDNKLSIVTEDKNGNLMIGSWGGGVSIITKDIVEKLKHTNALQLDEPIFENFSTTNGLSNDVVYGILEDNSGNIIIGTSLGFTILKGGLDPTGKNIAMDGIENFNQKTGYPIRDVSNNYSMLIDSRGFIWAGTGDKLVQFDYKSVQRNKNAPTVLVQSVKIDNENISWHSLLSARMNEGDLKVKPFSIAPYITDELNVYGRKLSNSERDTMISRFSDIRFDSIRPFYPLPENLVLPFNRNNISFDFVGIETTRPFLVRYQYMLEGQDKNWSPVSEETTVSYSNIFEGNYTFKLKAQSPDGIWSEPVTYSFEVLPPIYRSWPAYIFYAMLLLFVIFIFDRYQRKRLISRERQRTMKKELEQAKEIEKSYIELKQAQALLIHAEKMASLGELTAGIAHEIQNPLNFVNNFAEVNTELIAEMKAEIEKGNLEEVKAIANDIADNEIKITQHGKRADAIVKGMLQHSRSTGGAKEPTDVNALADEYLRLAYHGLRAKDKLFNATMKTDFDVSIGKINIVPQDIGRVILNLIVNAFYSVSEKKKQNPNGYDPMVSVITKRKDSRVYISIRDNGKGIPQKVLDKIFQPFFTTKPSGLGTGLGLSLGYDIIKAHGGELKVETREGEFAEFTIILTA